jgi:GntR family transcriptional regulator
VSDLAASGSGAEPLYKRVANDIASRIKSGELTPGTRLLAEPHMARYYGVAYHTIRGAMRVLRERGLIETVPGRGTFVRDPLPEDGPPDDSSP